MIVWIWIVSLIVLIAFSIFVYKMLITSSELLSTDKRTTTKLLRTNSRDKYVRKALETVNTKMKSLEDTHAYYQMQLTRMQQQFGESSQPETGATMNRKTPLPGENEEDWEEMYYAENEAKVQLENELDALRQKMEAVEEKYSALQVKMENVTALKSKYEGQSEEVISLKKQLEGEQMKLRAFIKRESELGQDLQKEISRNEETRKIRNENVLLKIELDDIRKQLMELFQKENERFGNMARPGEAESEVAVCEEQKISIRKVEKVLTQNKMFIN